MLEPNVELRIVDGLHQVCPNCGADKADKANPLFGFHNRPQTAVHGPGTMCDGFTERINMKDVMAYQESLEAAQKLRK